MERMKGIPAVLRESRIQNWWFRGYRHYFTARCVRMPDKLHQLLEGAPYTSVIWNSHSVIRRNRGPYKLSECKQQAQNNRLLSQVCPGDCF